MLLVDDAPSIEATRPELSVDGANLSVEGMLFPAIPDTGWADVQPIIGVGVILLAKEGGLASWHECEVVELDSDLVTLVWSGLPVSEVFTRRMRQLGSIHLQRMKPC